MKGQDKRDDNRVETIPDLPGESRLTPEEILRKIAKSDHQRGEMMEEQLSSKRGEG